MSVLSSDGNAPAAAAQQEEEEGDTHEKGLIDGRESMHPKGTLSLFLFARYYYVSGAMIAK
jgi:hypothetical protein